MSEEKKLKNFSKRTLEKSLTVGLQEILLVLDSLRMMIHVMLAMQLKN